MKPVPLHFVWEYTDVDRAFWEEHLEGWVPKRIIDAHVHMFPKSLQVEQMTQEKRRQIWVNEVTEPIDAPTLEHCIRTVFPGREVGCVAFGYPSFEFDIERSNDYVREEAGKRGWYSLALLRPEWSADRVEDELKKPGVIGVKPYYAMISPDRATRDKHLEASIFEFLPHRALEVLDDRRAWVTLHVPKAGRLGHPENIREVKEIRRRYPGVKLIIAHFGRSFTEPHALEALPMLAEDDGIYFDSSAVLNPAVHRVAMRCFGPRRILYGTDNPVFYMRGRREWRARAYINHTSYPFHFNTEREPAEVEAKYTLMMYEAIRAMKGVCEEMRIGREGVEAMFGGNARRLIEKPPCKHDLPRQEA